MQRSNRGTVDPSLDTSPSPGSSTTTYPLDGLPHSVIRPSPPPSLVLKYAASSSFSLRDWNPASASTWSSTLDGPNSTSSCT